MQTWVLYCSPACSKNDKERKQERGSVNTAQTENGNGVREGRFGRDKQKSLTGMRNKQKKSALQLIAEKSPGSQEKGQILARGS